MLVDSLGHHTVKMCAGGEARTMRSVFPLPTDPYRYSPRGGSGAFGAGPSSCLTCSISSQALLSNKCEGGVLPLTPPAVEATTTRWLSQKMLSLYHLDNQHQALLPSHRCAVVHSSFLQLFEQKTVITERNPHLVLHLRSPQVLLLHGCELLGLAATRPRQQHPGRKH